MNEVRAHAALASLRQTKGWTRVALRLVQSMLELFSVTLNLKRRSRSQLHGYSIMCVRRTQIRSKPAIHDYHQQSQTHGQ